MIIYEVNLTIDEHVFDRYYQWLLPHVEAMLKFDGFETATVQRNEAAPHQLTVYYRIKTRDNLENYLQHHAHTMRDDGLKKFPNQFSANRRIFEVINEF